MCSWSCSGTDLQLFDMFLHRLGTFQSPLQVCYDLIRGVHGLQIASLTLMKDHERLDLLKEIGGTRVYEERRKESLKIMVDTGK